MKKIFILSLPFDEVDTGDYDYCKAIESAINKNSTTYRAQYITGEDVDGYDRRKAHDLLSIISDKNTGGKQFYDSLENFYRNETRTELAQTVIDYVTKEQSPQGTLVNLQLRPPETGFLFRPQDLQQFKELGIKLWITCHEYELNYDRQWLQSLMHPYFTIADKVLFFNDQDQVSAAEHADHHIFVETILQNLQALPDRLQQGQLLKCISKATLPALSSFLNHPIPSVYVKAKDQMKDLDCQMLIGEVSFKSGDIVRYSIAGNITSAKPPITLEWGVWPNVSIHTNTTFGVSGIVIQPKNQIEWLNSTKIVKTEQKFIFNHNAYDLNSKSSLTRVPPTTAKVPNELDSFVKECMGKKPNIAIFGLIRENKGFEDVLNIIRDIKFQRAHDLPDTRLIIVGKAESYDVLAEILKSKYDLRETEHVTQLQL